MDNNYHATKAFEQAALKGRMDEKVDIARNLIKRGLSPQEISEDTGLNQESIEKLM